MTPVYFMRDIGDGIQQHTNYKQEIKIFALSIFDIISNVTNYLALLRSGSLMYQLVYSSILILNASFRHFLIPNTRLNGHQWIACLIVTFGLFIVGLSHNTTNDKTSGDRIANLCHCLIGTALYAFEYVITERLLDDTSMQKTTNELCWKMGAYNTFLVSIYLSFYVMPNVDELFWNEIEAHKGSLTVIVFGYMMLFISNGAHQWTYFALLKVSGSVSTGIIQSLRTIFVFIISATCFCHLEESQCFNVYKFMSLVVVMIGVMRYTQITAGIEIEKGKFSESEVSELAKSLESEIKTE